MLEGTIMFLAGAWTCLLAWRLVGKRPGESRRWDRWHSRFGKLLKVVGPILSVIGMAVLVPAIIEARSRPGVEPPPADPALRAKGGIVRSDPMRFELAFEPSWEIQPRRAEVDVLVLHPDSGAILVASAQVTRPRGASATKILDEVLEGRRQHWGAVEDVSRGATKIGGVGARWVAFTVPRGEDAARMKVTVAQRGPYTLSFSCTGAEEAQEACDEALARALMPE
jgi:hypothetical protein